MSRGSARQRERKRPDAAPGAAARVVLRTKLQAPTAHEELVARPALIEQLAAGERKVTLVAAPAGWGKTTLVAAWQRSEADERPFAWVSIDRWDNDPMRFWTHVVEAIRTVEPRVGDDTLALLRAPGMPLLETVMPALVNEVAALEQPLVLVLDDYHLIESAEIQESLAFLVEYLPPRLHLVLSTRSDPPLPLARLRARGELLEIRADDLRFSPEEAAELLNAALGLGLDDEDVARLHERTEGWAAGLYLAALSLRGRADPRAFIADFAGDDRHIVDYLGAEVLRGQPDEVRTFMLRTSVLERMTGPLCDAVTETAGSDDLLAEIERANLFLVPLDDKRRWYRYHHLFGNLLLHELRRAEADLLPALHRRAAAWYRDADLIPDAIHHALAGGDAEQAVELIALHWNTFFNQGRLATVMRWLASLPEAVVEADPRLCIALAWLALDLGRVDEVERWIDAAEAGIPTRAGADRRGPTRAETEILRTVHCFKVGDVGRANEAARRTIELAPADAVFPRTAARCVLGLTLYWSGETNRAIAALEEAVRLARSAGNDLAASYALGYLSVIRAERRELDAADELASTALGLSDEPGFAEHFTTMMAHLGRAKARYRRGDLEAAEAAALRALALGLRGAGRIEIAAAQLTLAEIRHARGAAEDARALAREARRALSTCPDPRGLAEHVDAVERRVKAAPRKPRATVTADEELTDRELAVLRLLESDLSQREIGAALYVSLNTVKTHTRAIFRKLDASSRSEAVERARSLGLLLL